ncbi:hypothetical protein GCK72_010769 [Caenorhabditis remanei]|uniref:imidazolonepropionase n=1 Tax=Caenorhabditis remanei TaxID=31234 RepID=A0A6A5H5N7_CAERE|nr:hypothetical protein GCK72_010769 [Caenorhabditis remanei]KAF1762507.1 hypothetical protein GCK72_010769 [Caenorhabditis remanei]
MYRLLVKGLKQVVQIVDDDVTEFLVGEEMNNIKILNDDSESLSILVDSNGKLSYIGEFNGVKKRLKEEGIDMEKLKVIDSKGGIAIPGFVDGHSHPVFAGDRVHEFAMKLAGATYMEISKKMLRSGTTTLEAKSGYGLNVDAEMKMLRVLSTENPSIPLEVSATFCGAHAVPKGSTEAEQTRMICDELIPKIEAEKRNGGLRNVENIDVFCEKGVFEVESSQKILKRGQEAGMAVNFHAEELKYIGGVEMGAKIGVSFIHFL